MKNKFLNELYFGPVDSDEKHKVFINPTIDELWLLLQKGTVRGIIDYDTNVYIWEENIAGHYTVSNNHNIKGRISFYVTKNPDKNLDAPYFISISRFTTPEEHQKDALKELFSNPKIQKMIGQTDFQNVLEISNKGTDAGLKDIQYIKPTKTFPVSRNQKLISKGVVIPGQKWWAPQSESFKEWLKTQ